MAERRLYAVSEGGVHRLALPTGAEEGPLDGCFAGRPTGAYAGLRTYGGRYFLGLEEHLARADRSLRSLGASAGLDEGALRRGLDRIAREWTEGDARMLFFVPATEVSGAPARSSLVAIEALQPPSPEMLRGGVEVEIARGLRRTDPKVKTSNWLDLRRRAMDPNSSAYEHLLLSKSGHVLEGTSSNVYFVRGGRLRTAGADVLEGITRGIVLGLCPGLGVPVDLAALHVDELSSVDEALLSSSTRELVPITRIGGRAVGDGRPGPVFSMLWTAYRERVAGLVRPAWPVGNP